MGGWRSGRMEMWEVASVRLKCQAIDRGIGRGKYRR